MLLLIGADPKRDGLVVREKYRFSGDASAQCFSMWIVRMSEKMPRP